jgi:hypothetical protein
MIQSETVQNGWQIVNMRHHEGKNRGPKQNEGVSNVRSLPIDPSSRGGPQPGWKFHQSRTAGCTVSSAGGPTVCHEGLINGAD